MEVLVRPLVIILSSSLFLFPKRAEVGSGPQELLHPPAPKCRLQYATQTPQDVNYSAQRLCIISAFHPGTVKCDAHKPSRRTAPDLKAPMQQLRAKASRPKPGPHMPVLCLEASPSLISGLLVQCSQCWILGSCLGPLPIFPVHHRGNPALQIHILMQTSKAQAVQCRAPWQTLFLVL